VPVLPLSVVALVLILLQASVLVSVIVLSLLVLAMLVANAWLEGSSQKQSPGGPTGQSIQAAAACPYAMLLPAHLCSVATCAAPCTLRHCAPVSTPQA
jgi:hypothetical protein